MANNDVQGLNELKQLLDEIGKLPQRCVTKAARKGGMILLRAVRAKAPVETGDLKKGLKLVSERRGKRGKKVYQVVFDAGMNDIFVKFSKDGKRSYYPASMEYGYITRNGGYIPGYRFMRDTADRLNGEVKQTMVEVLASELDKLR